MNRLRQFRRAGVEWVEWCHSGLDGEPRRCSEDAAKVLRLADAAVNKLD